MTTYVAKNGKTYPTHKNMIWVWARNCEVIEPQVDIEDVTYRANSVTDREVANLQHKCKFKDAELLAA